MPLFLLSLFLIKIPPFYLLFPIHSSILTSHTLARGIIFLLFFLLIAKEALDRKNLLNSKAKFLVILFLIYLFFQSISIVSTVNLASFLQRYKDVVFPGMFLFVALFLLKEKEKIIWVFLGSAVVNFFYEMFMFISPQSFKNWAPQFIYSAHLELVLINLERARIFIETYDEVAIPFLFIFFFKYKKPWQRLVLLLIFLMIALPSLLSNFRSRVLVLVLAFIASILFLTGKRILSKLSFLGLFVVFAIVAIWWSDAYFGFSVADRFALQDPNEDVQTLQFRARNVGTSFDMALSSPLTGIGLGNYYDNLSTQKKVSISLFSWAQREAQIAATNPHDIFLQTVSETGFVSLLFLVFLLFYFLVKDTRILFGGKNDFNKAAIISFWALFSYAVFNPTTTLTYNALFWLLRALVL